MGHLVLDEQRAVKVFRGIVQAWQERTHHFGHLDYIEFELLPPEIAYGTRDHALLLFFWAYLMRFGQGSRQIMQQGAQLFLEHPEIADPLLFPPSPQLLVGIIPFSTDRENPLPGFEEKPSEGQIRIRGWLENLELLRDDYESDPRNILLAAGPNRDRLVEEFTHFYGIRDKIAQLAIIWLQEIDWPERKAEWQTIRQVRVFPVDLWIMRLMCQFDIVKDWHSDNQDRLRKPIGDFIVAVCEKYNIDHIDLSQALWQIGATICRNRPNKAKHPEFGDSYCLDKCPAHDYCVRIVKGTQYQKDGRMRFDLALPRLSLFSPRPA